MKTMQCAHAPHRHNGIVVTCDIYTYTHIYVVSIVYIYDYLLYICIYIKQIYFIVCVYVSVWNGV